ncbi:MAG: DUF1156 domain-containing protein [Candidatus Methanomethylicia archaeon]|nr:DUF1156 domain-containing protein [Candidatus Methanomethylicia archaeon]
MNRFIESPLFPINEINEFSAREKQGGGRPPYWEMIFWWTRKPLIGARAIIAGSLLPADYNLREFKHIIRILPDIKSPHRENPHVFPQIKEYFSRIKLLDPFAGFGSIPLEGIRLGLGEVVAIELLPTAYIFLKAILEYPKNFGNKLIKDVEYWGKWIIDRLREDSDIKELYDEDIAVYIGSWEIKCPHCGKYTPLIGNWWLARVSGRSSNEEENEEDTRRGIFRRLAWMMPYISSDIVGIRVVDLNKELNREEINARINTRQGVVDISGRIYNVPRPNIDARRETAICLLCNNTIRKIGKEWYVKEALKEYNNNIERYLRGEITIKDLMESKARPRILVKVKIVDGDLEFESALSEDNERLWKALEKIKQMWGDPDIPMERIPPYGHTGGGLRFPTYAIDKWYQFFNPCQLLTLVKLVKLIRGAGKQVEQEKVKEGLSREEAFKYAEAVTTYLAIVLVRYADYNSLCTVWNYGGQLPAQVAHTLSMRGIAMMWNWGDVSPFARMSGTGTLLSNFDKVTDKILPYLIFVLSNSLESSKIRILLDDATTLSKISDETFDIIVTDPPYRDDVAYAELSDFYYVWLKRALSDIKEVFGVLKLVPRFHKDAFFDDFGNEIETQWKAFALKEISENEGRIKYFGENISELDHFKSLLSQSFMTMASRLKDDGLLVTYYAHTSPDAWEALLEAGWLNAKMRITTAHAIATESTESVVARGKIRLDMAIVAVWRKGISGEALVDEVYAKTVEICSKDAIEYRKAGLDGVNLFVAVLGKVLSQFTQYERLIGIKADREGMIKNLVEKYIYPATAEAIARSYGVTGAKLSPTSMFYLLTKVLVGRRLRQIRRTLDRTTAIILSIGTRSDLKDLEDKNVIVREEERLTLLEPRWGTRNLRESIEDTLMLRNLNPREPNILTAIDVLHLLEYYAITLPKEDFKVKADEIRAKISVLFDEAIALAKILASGLPLEDPERELTKQVINLLGVVTLGTLDLFIKR